MRSGNWKKLITDGGDGRLRYEIILADDVFTAYSFLNTWTAPL
jgi:hypothetical protein